MMKEGELSDLKGKVKKLEVQVIKMTSSSAEQQGIMEKSVASP